MNTLDKLEEVLFEITFRDGGQGLTIMNDVVLTNKELSEVACKLSELFSEVNYTLNKKVGE